MKTTLPIIALAFAGCCYAQPADNHSCPIFSDPAYQARYEKQVRALEGPYIARAQQALPTANDLPGFRFSREYERPLPAYVATRLSDQAQLKIYIYATTNQTALDILSRGGILPNNVLGPLPKGTPSGKPLGQVAWKSHPFGGDGKSTELIDYELRVLDRPSLVYLRMTSHIGQDEHGRPQWKPITKADQLFMEQVARGILRRLHALKLTHDTFRGS